MDSLENNNNKGVDAKTTTNSNNKINLQKNENPILINNTPTVITNNSSQTPNLSPSKSLTSSIITNDNDDFETSSITINNKKYDNDNSSVFQNSPSLPSRRYNRFNSNNNSTTASAVSINNGLTSTLSRTDPDLAYIRIFIDNSTAVVS